jgi:hypothetical protein
MATNMIDIQAAKKSMRVPPQRWGLTLSDSRSEFVLL